MQLVKQQKQEHIQPFFSTLHVKRARLKQLYTKSIAKTKTVNDQVINKRKILLHYLLNSSMFDPDIFTAYGGAIMILSTRYIKIHISPDYFGSAYTEQLLNMELDTNELYSKIPVY